MKPFYTYTFALLLIGGMTVHTLHAQNAGGGAIISFNGTLAGANEVPPVAPAGSGTFTGTLDVSTLTLSVSGSYSGMTSAVTGSHVHDGAAGSNGGVIISLTNTGGTDGTFSGMGVLTAAQIVDLLNNGLYVNIHTVNNGPGEIRDQVTLASAISFTGDLVGTNEVPPVTPSGTGSFTGSYDPGTQALSVSGSYTGMTSGVTGSHVHDGAAGSNGGVIISLTNTGGTDGTFSGSGLVGNDLTEDQVVDMLQNGLYVNIHTGNNPGGEIRDQVNLVANPLPVELTGFDALSDADGVTLAWTTATETDNAGFEVQVLADTWQTLAFVDGVGTTNEAQSYRYRVTGLTPGLHRFRLKQVDFDGAFAYSPTVQATVDLPGAYFLSEVYPNPFNPTATFTLTLAVDQDVRVEVFDVLGRSQRILHNGTLPAQEVHTFRLDAGGLPSGLYLIRTTGARFEDTRTVTLLK